MRGDDSEDKEEEGEQRGEEAPGQRHVRRGQKKNVVARLER